MTIEKKLLDKYGKPIKKDDFYYQGIVKHIKGQYLNVYFSPINKNCYKKVEEILEWKMPEELKKFYNLYNGVMLFCESFRIFGYAVDDEIHDVDTLDIILGNLNTKMFLKMPQYTNMVIFGTAGYYYFCYNRNYDGKIYVIGSREKDVVKTYYSLKELLEYYVDYLTDEYDENGKKKHIEKNSIGSIYENTTYEFY